MRCSNVAAEATRGVRGTPSSRFHSYTTPRRHDQNGVGWGDSDVFDEERVWIYLADERGEGRVTVDQAVLTEVLERAFLDPRRDDEGGYAIHFFFFLGGGRGRCKARDEKEMGTRVGRTGDQVCQRKTYDSSRHARVLCR